MKRSLVIAVTMSLAVLAFLFTGCDHKKVKENPQAKTVVITKVGDTSNTKLEKITLTEGDTFVLRVMTDPLNARVTSMSSSDESVAKVDMNTNTITAISKGTAKVTVTVGRNNLSADLLVAVNPKPTKKPDQK